MAYKSKNNRALFLEQVMIIRKTSSYGMIFAIALFCNALRAEEPKSLESLEPLPTLELKGRTFHVQGIDLDDERLWVTSVEKAASKGYLHVFNLKSGEEIRTVEIQAGAKIHPGGMAADADSLWIPVAEYRAKSASVIQRRDKNTLELLFQFEVADHIGCLAADDSKLIGGNWDSRELYYWDKQGKLLERKSNPTGNRFQDLKLVGGELVGSGSLQATGGTVDWLDPKTLALRRRISGGKTDRGVSYMHEGMAIRGGVLYLLPEDGPSRLFAFRLP